MELERYLRRRRIFTRFLIVLLLICSASIYLNFRLFTEVTRLEGELKEINYEYRELNDRLDILQDIQNNIKERHDSIKSNLGDIG